MERGTNDSPDCKEALLSRKLKWEQNEKKKFDKKSKDYKLSKVFFFFLCCWILEYFLQKGIYDCVRAKNIASTLKPIFMCLNRILCA